jgi:N-acyl-D-amino-acid deacylase
MPGCIDAHSHADQTLLWFPEAQNFIMQGVTTVIAGQCGSTPAPIKNEMPLPSMLRDYLFEISPHKYSPENRLFSREVVNEWMDRVYGWTISYETMSEWFKMVEARGTSINIASNIGHGTCRYQVLGEDFDRVATTKEVEEITEHVIQGMRDGCVGVSVGLDYDPGYFADENELLSIVGCVKEFGGIYNPHFRKNIRAKDVRGKYYNRYYGYIEVLDHARKTGTSLHISHLCPTYGPNKYFTEAWDVNETPEMLFEAAGKASMVPLVEALEEGMDLSFDTIMWPWPRKRVMPYLCSVFTPYLKMFGSRERFAEWLKAPDFRKEITKSLWEPTGSNAPIFKNPQFPDLIYVTVAKNKDYEGKTIREISLMLGKEPFEAYLDLIADDPNIRGAIEFIFSAEREIREYFKHPLCSVSLDSSAFNNSYELKNPPYSLAGQDMRSTFSGFPAFFETYVKNQNLFTIEEAVQKWSYPRNDGVY